MQNKEIYEALGNSNILILEQLLLAQPVPLTMPYL